MLTLTWCSLGFLLDITSTITGEVIGESRTSSHIRKTVNSTRSRILRYDDWKIWLWLSIMLSLTTRKHSQCFLITRETRTTTRSYSSSKISIECTVYSSNSMFVHTTDEYSPFSASGNTSNHDSHTSTVCTVPLVAIDSLQLHVTESSTSST